MSVSDVQKELDQLRKEVAALSAARKQKEATSAQNNDNASSDAEEDDAGHEIKGQIEELIKLLQDEIRDMPALTALAVFALGVLMGRLLR
jgi:hypothetical protein